VIHNVDEVDGRLAHERLAARHGPDVVGKNGLQGVRLRIARIEAIRRHIDLDFLPVAGGGRRAPSRARPMDSPCGPEQVGAENLIKEANNDADLAAHPSHRWMMNANWFQIVMLAYNPNCWLLLFNREKTETVETLRHTTLVTAHLQFLFLAAKIQRHAGRVGVSYSDHYQEQSIFQRLTDRLRAIASGAHGFAPVVPNALRC